MSNGDRGELDAYFSGSWAILFFVILSAVLAIVLIPHPWR